MTLETKLDLTRQRLKEVLDQCDSTRIAVAWTGGKDSTVALWLWREVLLTQGATRDRVKALCIDTGLKFPETLTFRRNMAEQWAVQMHMARPGVDLTEYPVAKNPVQCCYDLKISPLNQVVRDEGIAILITGVRADEHPSRQGRPWQEKRSDPQYIMAHPLLHWTEMDIWSFTLQQGLPYCSLYDQGYRSLGCRPCTQPSGLEERSGRDGRKEHNLQVLQSLGYF